jgi:AraC family transcriptional regulator
MHISGYEFHRAFSFLAGMTVTTYIRNRRLSLAARDIVETDSKITDIALKYGYETPESFTKAFTRFHGVAPKFARAERGRLVLFNPFVIKLTVEGGKCMDYRIVETKPQRFVALVENFRNDIINDEKSRDIPDFWEACQQKNRIDPLLALRPSGKKDLYGLCAPAKEGKDTFEYGIGILVDEETTEFSLAELENAGYRIWEIASGTYAVFECIGEDGDCISDTWGKFYKEFLPQMGYEAEETTDYELYPENPAAGLFCELWIPIRRKN